MKTFRPQWMKQEPIAAFETPQIDSDIAFMIECDAEVVVIEKNIQAIDPIFGSFYKNPILLYLVEFNEKQGYVNKRYLR